jgi:regulator of RNase E activity RraA
VTKASIGIWARGLNLLRPNYLEVASIGEPVVCGGAQVHTGDLVIADADGAVIVPPEELDLLGRAVAHIEVVERDVKEAINRQASPSEIATLLGRKSQIPDAR